MMFRKDLRPRVRSGEITSSVRVWLTPRVKVGARYPLLDGQVEITRLVEVDADDITDAIAREGGFADRDELMKTARHGRGERVFIVEFVFVSGSGG